ncbi:hypothetical protein MKW92_053916 [Papaver armeniacum]|nr:hypothetical protein MKW92_053916 [Papaver armeniacum]
MATNLQELQVAINGEKDDEEEQKFLEQPMSPSSQCFNTSILCYSILAFLEFESEIIDSKISQHLQKLLPILNPRFTSIVLRNDDGTQRWRKLNVDMVHLDEDHIKVAEFPKGLTPKDYDKHLEDYAFAIHKEGFPEGKPLWQVHLIKYPTSNAVSTLIFKLHHVLGDGYSLMGILLSCLQRVDDPSLPITFPTSTKLLKKNKRNCSQGLKFVSVCWNTVLDFGDSVIQSMLGEDDKTVIRSGKPGLESEPISISSISLSLQDISLVKSKVNGTVNDIVVGIIFYGIRLYMRKMGQESKDAKRVRAFVVVNTRMLAGYQSVEEMAKANTYGHRISCFPLRVPTSGNVEKMNPMDFVLKAKKTMRRKKHSLAVFLTGGLLHWMGKIKGAEGISSFIYKNSKKTSLGISNLVCPREKTAMAGHPVKGFYFAVMGTPRSLGIYIMSYMDKLRLVVTAEKEFIDSELLVSCMKEAFQNIYEASSWDDKDRQVFLQKP